MTRLCLILILLAGCNHLQVDAIPNGAVVHVRVPIPVQVERRRTPTASVLDMWKYTPWCCRPERGDNMCHHMLPTAICNMSGPDTTAPCGVLDMFDGDGDGDVDLRDIVKLIAWASETVAFLAARFCRRHPERCHYWVPGG